MPEILVISSVTRASLSLGPLEIENVTNPSCPYSYVRDGMSAGARSMRRVTAESPWVAGRVLVHAIPDVMTLNVNLRVRAASSDALDANIATVANAFSQTSFSLIESIDGVTHQYECEAADWALGDGGQYQDLELRSYTQEIKFVVPASPVPTVGRF